jgi:hypothetical protein
LDVLEGAKYLDIRVFGVGANFAVGFKRGLAVWVIAELGHPVAEAGMAESIDVLIVVYGAEEGSLGCCSVRGAVNDIS